MKRINTYYLSFILSSLLCLKTNSIKATDTLLHIYCLERLITAKEFVPIGCEIVDCCIGCPKSGITLSFSFKTQKGITIVLLPENINTNILQKIKLSGKVILNKK